VVPGSDRSAPGGGSPSLELDGVHKRFGAVRAVAGVTLSFERNRVHAVVGENGAGKSTLLRIGAGLLAPDEGEVRVNGRRLDPHTPAEAIARGVAMVQQHFALVDAFTALENIVLGVEPVRSPLARLDMGTAREKVAAIMRELGAEIPLDARVSSLGVGDRQRLEIVRALYRDTKTLILDEPTAVLTPGEADALYAILRRLADGRAIVVVTHKLDEVRAYADVATVMRHGAIVETREVTRTEETVRQLADAMMGATSVAAPSLDEKAARVTGDPVIVVNGLHVGRRVRGLSLEVRGGEIVGVAGVEGNGQRELVRALAGLEAPDAGTIDPPAGELAIVHEDRHQDGLVLDASVRDNTVLGELARFSRRGIIDRGAVDREALARVEMAQAPRDLDSLARALSGGNQQKLVVARAIARIGRARGLVAAHPTRGVDLAAARAIHERIRAAAAAGAAVLVVSADLAELRALCDRLIVIARGRISAELPAGASDAEIGHAMLAGGTGVEKNADRPLPEEASA
jgi:general nucleoside transport system ATP-binding protein